MSNAAKDVRAADEASHRVTPHAEDDGVAVTGASTPDHDKALIPWDQAVAVARRIIELARARGDIS
jgi:BioD-like phosphotransacetylase family protein